MKFKSHQISLPQFKDVALTDVAVVGIGNNGQ